MKDIGIAIGQKWITRDGDIVVIVLDEKDDQPFKTSDETWHFRDGMMWRHRKSGGDLIRRVDDEEDDETDFSEADEVIKRIKNMVSA